MSRDLMNWSFDEVAAFLEQHFFNCIKTRGSHFYYQGLVDGEIVVVEVQRHSGEAIKPRTLKHSIIAKSGIPAGYWKAWANAGNKRARAEIQYPGAEAP